VRGQGKRSLAALVTALVLAAALSACGGSGSGGSTSTGGQPPAAEPGGENGAATAGGNPRRSDDSSGGEAAPNGSGAKVETAPLKVSGGGSDQFRVRGGDNSVQEFGEESDESELEEAATTLHAYLVARAEEDWPAACGTLAKSVKAQLRALASRAEDLKGEDCAAILAALTPTLPPAVRRESTIVDAGSLRVEGEQAFLIYRGAEGKTYTVLMAPEDSGWKVGSLAATPLS
jgi:hypothetical protein